MVSDTCNHPMTKDVIVEILSNLPVKSLLRFKCVCKYWKNVMDASFIRKHLQRSQNNVHLIVQHYYQSTERYALAMFNGEALANMPLVYRDFENLQMPSYQCTVIGPCDGVIGFYDGYNRDRDRMALWNPATREFKVLPMPYPNYFSIDIKPFIHVFGMGLDVKTNNYKVVCIRSFWDEKKDYPYLPKVVTVYTIDTNAWRIFETDLPDCSIEMSQCNTYKSGVYYWILIRNLRDYSVLSFDMSSEAFEELTGPPDLPTTQWGELGMYGDCIAMILHNAPEAERIFDIWVMKEDGSWTKELSVGPLLEIERLRGMWKNGELFLETSSSHLVLYDHKTQETKQLGLGGHNSCLRVCIYQESLVSVVGKHEFKEEENTNFLTREPNISMGVQEFLLLYNL